MPEKETAAPSERVETALETLNYIIDLYDQMRSDVGEETFLEFDLTTFNALFQTRSMQMFVRNQYEAARVQQNDRGSYYIPSLTRLTKLFIHYPVLADLAEARRKIIGYEDVLHCFSFDRQQCRFVKGEVE